MRKVMAVIDEWRERIEDHPLHRWLAAEDEVFPEHRLWFALYFTNFIMYFRELNLYHISYREARGMDPGREAISAHADEDMTHSRLFMRDFKTLGWDDLLGWKPSEVFHWLFSSEVNEQLRRRTTAIAKLVIEAEDPAVRFAVSEAIEACGNALFRHTTEAANRYTARTGKELVYWGQFHLERETGHAVDENVFEEMLLTRRQREAAIRRAVRVFELIDEQNSDMLTLAQETVSQGGFDFRRARHAAASIDGVEAVEPPKGAGFNFWPSDPHPSQQPVLDTLHKCTESLHGSRSVEFFVTDDLEQSLIRLRAALLFHATDTLGSVTLYRHMVSYPFATDAVTRALNRMARRFGGPLEQGHDRRSLFFVDWASLELDDVLAWPVSRTLEFIYLDAATEPWRDMRAVATHHIDATQNPVLRYWAILALKSLNTVQGRAMADLAHRVERQAGLRLPHLTLKINAQRPELEPDPEADAIRFESLPLAPDAAQQAVTLVGEIHEAFVRRFDTMIEAVRQAKYPLAL
ncbi:hypothetical protein [Wenjunlia tyrosinilytica]|uniref:Uncharacterized protein n=1 Tax=Wenjunlia tyrosinilytica TaxID=1544741 RepID=A0A917ZP90_9ACTN|nr:hypothetical protein [Wenjunlia tyrosinilytica]GGO87996.1 hypothetical protein GCM10012280_27770 [Wenjunlia tyrosinilytica]